MSAEPKIEPAFGTRPSADTAQSQREEHDKVEHTTPPAGKGSDISAQWLETYTGPRPQIDDVANKLVRNRIDRYLMPICFYIYWCQQLDKSSVSLVCSIGILGVERRQCDLRRPTSSRDRQS